MLKQVFETVNETTHLLHNLDSISDAIGVPLGEKVELRETEVIRKSVLNDTRTTYCGNCDYLCHKICNCWCSCRCSGFTWRQLKFYCRVCPGKCHWTSCRNETYNLVSEEENSLVFPEELIKHWNDKTNSLEGAALDAMGKYIKLQKELKGYIDALVKVTDTRKKESLKHNPSVQLNYWETLLRTAKQQGASPEQIETLNGAKNATNKKWYKQISPNVNWLVSMSSKYYQQSWKNRETNYKEAPKCQPRREQLKKNVHAIYTITYSSNFRWSFAEKFLPI